MHPKVAKVTRSQGEPAFRISMDLPISQEVIRTVESARGATVKIPNSGGTGPDVAGHVLHIPGIGVPIGNHDNNQHSFNENLRIQNLWDGIELMAALLTM
jgi:acetylornithine deacetylase/succinyl-diaminopimelate desuccinylase-like protein